MLRIQLKKQSSDVGAPIKPLPVETVTVACPDHLVLADLPVAKGIGAATAATVVKNIGRRSRRQLGERVHFCVRCDFPIAIYGRLSPCEHAFCLDCARSDSICYLCDDRIQKIQTIKIMEGLFICAAPHCLKSFLKRSDFESHIHQNHTDLLQPNAEKDNDNESEVQSVKQPAPSESTARGLARSGSNSQFLDEEKARRQQTREQPLQRPMMPKPPFYGQGQNYMSDPQIDTNRPPGFDRPVFQNRFQQGGPAQESGQQGISSDTGMPEYPSMQAMQQPNFLVPMNANPMMPPQFALPPFQPDGVSQQFYGAHFEMGQMGRQDAAAEGGSEQGSLLGFPPGATAGGMNFMANYPQPWNVAPPQVSQGMGEGFTNSSDSQGNAAFYQGDYGRQHPGIPPMVPPPKPTGSNKGMEGQGAGNMDPRDGKGILAAPQQQPFLHPPPPPPIPHPSQSKRGNYYSGEGSHDGQAFGWQQENRDSFGSGQD
ncbi:E3 ubiquitin-protein ligase HAKAI homolog [Linum perenne]